MILKNSELYYSRQSQLDSFVHFEGQVIYSKVHFDELSRLF